jgi:hypothetical protein
VQVLAKGFQNETADAFRKNSAFLFLVEYELKENVFITLRKLFRFNLQKGFFKTFGMDLYALNAHFEFPKQTETREFMLAFLEAVNVNLFFSCLEECCHKSKDVAKLDIQSIF